MNAKLIAALISALILHSAPEASAQRAARGPAATRAAATRTIITRSSISRRHSRDFDRYRRATSFCAPRRAWVPGHNELRTEKVVVPGRCEQVFVPARFETRFDTCGRAFTVQIQTAHWETIQHASHVKYVKKQVWVPGHWETRRQHH